LARPEQDQRAAVFADKRKPGLFGQHRIGQIDGGVPRQRAVGDQRRPFAQAGARAAQILE